jgi:glycosyltransferase involved in cell wall biosynthesis
MKIGYIMQAGVPDMRRYPPSGPANHVRQVHQELVALGHQVRILAFQDRHIWKTDDLENFDEVHVRWFDDPLPHLFERIIRRIQFELKLPYAAIFESLRFAQACAQELDHYDFLYERMGWFGYGGVMASRRMKIPLVLEVNGDHLSEFEFLGIDLRGVQRWLSIMLVRRATHMATRVVATGEGWKQRFIDRWGVDPDRVAVVENGSEIVNLLSRDQLRCFQSGTGIDKQVTLIFIGVFETWQGLQILIPSVAKLISQGLPIHLILIGDGTLSAELKRLVHELAIDAQVTFTGHLTIQQVSAVLASADIGVSPYCGRPEYSGLKLFDYKAAGLAIIASGENGQPAVIEHGRTGWIVPPCDEVALCEAIAELVTNDERRMLLGQEARLDAERFHSWKNTAREIENLLLEIARPPSYSLNTSVN